MAPRVPDDATLTALRSGFAGEVVAPGDPSYDESRTLFNAMIDRRPSVIALCETVEDVAAAIRFGRERGLEVAVRGGGHSVAGNALTDGGIVVDLRRMHAVVVDPGARTARVGGGATMSHLDRATQPYDLVTTGGRVSTTGVGGFTLGGGSGWLERAFGLACDNLVEVELMTADGTMVRAAEDENPELFWALHGGGGNFGVATSLTLRLHPLPAVTMALLLWPPDAGPEVLRAYRTLLASAPDEMGGGLLFLTGPAEEFVPEHLVGALTCAVLVTYAGTGDAAREVLEPLLALGPQGRLVRSCRTRTCSPCSTTRRATGTTGRRSTWTTSPTRPWTASAPGPGTWWSPPLPQHVLFPVGGAVARPPADYPLPWRRAPWVVHPFGLWADPADDERARRWAHGIRADVRQWSCGAVYLNFIGDEGEGRVIAGFGAHNLGRLARVKREYDPQNVFRLNHNIEPD